MARRYQAASITLGAIMAFFTPILAPSATAQPWPLPPPAAPSAAGAVMASVPLAAAASPVPLPKSPRQLPALVQWNGRPAPLADLLTQTNTRAFLVVHRGHIAHEYYGNSTAPATALSSWSIAKAPVALIVGQAVAERKLALTDKLVDILPAFRTGGPYDGITVRHLLDMQSGVDIPEGTSGTAATAQQQVGSFLGTPAMTFAPDLDSYLMQRRTLTFAPGSKGEYTSGNTQLLSMVLAAVYQRPFIELVRDRVWNVARPEYAATWNLDRPGGIAKGFCCLNATARDFARLGLLVLGQHGQQPVLSQAWRERIFSHGPSPAATLEGVVYSTGFWQHPATRSGGTTAEDVSMMGAFGQFTYINRKTGTVIVKLSDDAIAGTRTAEQFLAMRDIAHSLNS